LGRQHTGGPTRHLPGEITASRTAGQYRAFRFIGIRPPNRGQPRKRSIFPALLLTEDRLIENRFLGVQPERSRAIVANWAIP
jgi:hypothetical protein